MPVEDPAAFSGKQLGDLLCKTIQAVEEGFRDGGLHPSLSGREQVIGLLCERFYRSGGRVEKELSRWRSQGALESFF